MKHFKACKRISALALAVVMLLSVMPVGLLSASAAITPDGQWSTSGTTLRIEDADDLWAFATALNGGTTFAGKTILLEADITVNEGWDAFSDAVPNDKYPLTAQGKHFAGTFDGQGHTVSGLYLATSGFKIGFFGNVDRATTPTVKNLTIVNSAIRNSDGSLVGGIFGDIYTESATVITDDNYVNKTKATIDNVHLDINITAGGQYGGSYNGVGGFVGCNRADVSITNSSIDGRISTASRGVAAFVGAVYPNQIDGYDHDGDSSTATVTRRAHFTNTRIENCVNTATVDVSASGATRFAGALVGYSNSNTDRYEIRNVLSLGRMLGTSDAANNPIGYLFGGSWCTENSYRNGSTMDYQTWTLENVYYEALPECSYKAFEKTPSGIKISGEPTAISPRDLEKHFTASMRQNLAIKNDLAMNILVTVADHDAVVTIDDVEVLPTRVDGWERVYTLDGILPQYLRDTVTVKVTQTFGDRTVVSEQTTSVHRYLQNLWSMEQTTEVERDLIADLLRYGEQAQIFENYKTDTVATYGFALDGYGSSYDVASIPTQYSVSGTENADYDINAVSLLLDNSPSLWLKLKATDTTDLTVKVTVNGRERSFSASEISRYGTEYVVSFDGIGAHEMNATVTAALYKNGVQVGTSLTYSIADYVKNLLSMDAAGNEELAAYQALVGKMYAYGLSAQAYNDSTRQIIDAEYVIVYDDGASSAVKAAAQGFADALKAKTGLSLRVVADTTAAQAKEILIGNMNGRSDSTTEKAKITANNGNGYRAVLSGQRLVICGNDYLIEYAAARVVETIRLHGGSAWSLPLGYADIVDVPAITKPSGSSYKMNIQYAESGNYSWSLTGGSALSTTYSSYQTQLTNAGFRVYTTNTIGNNTFTTYIKTENGYNTAVHAVYYPNTQNIRITYGPVGYLPGTEAIDVTETGVATTPSIILNARATSYAGASGMSLMLQLVDGSFIIIDGGNPDQSLATKEKENGSWVTNEAAMTEDAKHLYELLDEMTPGDAKPRVAAWIITHAHGDHIGMANQFVKTYHTHVDVDLVAYNFPDFDTVTITNESAASMDSLADTFVSQMKTYYPNAPHWVMHSGQKQYLPGCEIETFYTPEDYYGNSSTDGTFPWGNQTSIAFRITLGDTTMMVLGDCEADICLQMANNYKDALESDILQVTHHGSNGANYSFYSYIDPKICIWPVDRYNFENGTNQLGSSTASQTSVSSYMYANWWLRNTQWTRGDGTSGNRTHYAVEAYADSILYYPVNKDFVIVTPSLKF